MKSELIFRLRTYGNPMRQALNLFSRSSGADIYCRFLLGLPFNLWLNRVFLWLVRLLRCDHHDLLLVFYLAHLTRFRINILTSIRIAIELNANAWVYVYGVRALSRVYKMIHLKNFTEINIFVLFYIWINDTTMWYSWNMQIKVSVRDL